MPDGTAAESMTVTTVPAMTGTDRDTWQALAQPDPAYYPFTDFRFLDCLEHSCSVRPEVGWAPSHLTLTRSGTTLGVMPLYLKGHSRGEFVFDQGWADAYERAGGRYYPKLLGAVPFTPATGPRLLAPDDETRRLLARAARQMTDEMGVSSLHLNFVTAREADLLSEEGFLIRKGTQYRFEDDGFGDWDGFLSALASRKRKGLRKERASIPADGVEIDWITGGDITEAHLDHFWTFYQDTGVRKWGSPYLTRSFFSRIVAAMPERILFVMARRGNRYIAGAMNFIGGDTLFGRYWGCSEYVPFLHFELCYYQAIDFALAHGLAYVDAGAQGEHKIARGYRPVTTYSAHYLPNESFHDAVARYLEAEAREVDGAIAYLSDFTPFRKEGG